MAALEGGDRWSDRHGFCLVPALLVQGAFLALQRKLIDLPARGFLPFGVVEPLPLRKFLREKIEDGTDSPACPQLAMCNDPELSMERRKIGQHANDAGFVIG